MAKEKRETPRKHEQGDGGTVRGIAKGMGATEETVRQLAEASEGASRLTRDERTFLASKLPHH